MIDDRGYSSEVIIIKKQAAGKKGDIQIASDCDKHVKSTGPNLTV